MLDCGAHQAERLITPTINDFEENGPTCLCRGPGSEVEKISGKLHLPIRVFRSKLDVRDAAIGCKRGIYGEERASDNPLIRTEIIAAPNFDAA